MFVSNLDKKISETIKLRTLPTLCAWSDLLGFANPFIESNWEPNNEQYLKIAQRLRDAQIICARNLEPHTENILVSNDAFIRNLNFEQINHVQLISMWFRSLIWFHMAVNTHEKELGYPGMRTVIAGGERLLHNFEEVTFEDYVYNYTKKDPNGISSISQQFGDKTIMYNLSAFQMNTAFSKSYILDSAGSKEGIEGSCIYIDESVFRVIKSNLPTWGLDESAFKTCIQKDNTILYVDHAECGWYHMGFEISEPICINNKRINTKVYRLLYFYPWDEDPSEFKIDVFDKYPSLLNPSFMPEI